VLPGRSSVLKGNRLQVACSLYAEEDGRHRLRVLAWSTFTVSLRPLSLFRSQAGIGMRFCAQTARTLSPGLRGPCRASKG